MHTHSTQRNNSSVNEELVHKFPSYNSCWRHQAASIFFATYYSAIQKKIPVSAMTRRRGSGLSALLSMTVLVSLFHDAASSSVPHGYLNSGKRRTRNHEQMTVRHLDEDELYNEHADIIPQSRSQPRRYQWRDTRTSKVIDEKERLESERMPLHVHHVNTSEMAAPDNGEIFHGTPSRALRQSENRYKQQKNQIQSSQHVPMEQELEQYQYGEFGLPSSRESDGAGNYEDRPKGMVLRRGRLFHNNNSKGSKRNGKAHKWSKSSKWSKNWNECYWEDTP